MNVTLRWPDHVPTTEYSQEFLQGMLDRMAASHPKYGSITEPDKQTDFLAALRDRLREYQKSGNTEWLMDVANFAMIEFVVPQHRDAHYRSTDSDESPGLVTRTGGRVFDGRVKDRQQ